MELTTWYLELTDSARIRAARPPSVPVEVTRVEVASPELSRHLYTAVGGDWSWTDRLPWTGQQWHDWLARPGVETWVATVGGAQAGYVELDGHEPGVVEITYFGLLPQFTGQGIGGHLLEVALRTAWDLAGRWDHQEPIRRVWLHTCSLDGPVALANYQARGLSVYRTEVTPGADRAEPPGAAR